VPSSAPARRARMALSRSEDRRILAEGHYARACRRAALVGSRRDRWRATTGAAWAAPATNRKRGPKLNMAPGPAK